MTDKLTPGQRAETLQMIGWAMSKVNKDAADRVFYEADKADEAARRAAEAEDEYGLTKADRARGAVSPKEMRQMLEPNAPPPTAPDAVQLVLPDWARIIGRHLRLCGTAGLADVCDEIADAIEALRARVGLMETERSERAASHASEIDALRAREKRLREALQRCRKRLFDLEGLVTEGQTFEAIQIADNALAQGGNDG